MNIFSKNLRFLREKRGMKLDDFGFLDIKKGTMSNYELGNTEPKIDLICKLSKFFGIDIDEFLTKDLSTNISSTKTYDIPNTNHILEEPIDIYSNKKVEKLIPIVDINVAAGIGGCLNGEYIEVENNICLPGNLISFDRKYYALKIKGDSMAPTLLDSSYIIVKLLERSEWEDLPDKHICVVSDKEGKAYIKRIKNRFKKHGFIVCMSDNPNKVIFPNFNIIEEEINTIWHAEWYLSPKMPNIHETYYNKIEDMSDDIDLIKQQINQIVKNINK